jgi:hypothetical protein
VLESGDPPNSWDALLQKVEDEAQIERLERVTTPYINENDKNG